MDAQSIIAFLCGYMIQKRRRWPDYHIILLGYPPVRQVLWMRENMSCYTIQISRHHEFWMYWQYRCTFLVLNFTRGDDQGSQKMRTDWVVISPINTSCGNISGVRGDNINRPFQVCTPPRPKDTLMPGGIRRWNQQTELHKYAKREMDNLAKQERL